jgi:hypothetical protein
VMSPRGFREIRRTAPRPVSRNPSWAAETCKGGRGPADPIHVTLLNANRRCRSGVTIHRAQTLETRQRHGLTTTSPTETLRQLTGEDYERAYNEAQIQRPVPRDPNDGMTRSEAERKLLALIHKAGLPRPRTNVKVCGHEVTSTGPSTGWWSSSTAGRTTVRGPRSSATATATRTCNWRESA